MLPRHIIIGIKSSASHNAAQILLAEGKQARKEYLSEFRLMLKKWVESNAMTQAQFTEIMIHAKRYSKLEARLVQKGLLEKVSGHGASQMSVKAQFEYFSLVVKQVAGTKEEK